jgi:hypothetical protein
MQLRTGVHTDCRSGTSPTSLGGELEHPGRIASLTSGFTEPTFDREECEAHRVPAALFSAPAGTSHASSRQRAALTAMVLEEPTKRLRSEAGIAATLTGGVSLLAGASQNRLAGSCSLHHRLERPDSAETRLIV